MRQGKESAVGGAGSQPAATDAGPGPVAAALHDRRVTLSLEYFRSVARVMADAGEALQHAHEKHVLHRDVKPSNILIDTDGKCWLIDFGLAYCNGNSIGGIPFVSAAAPCGYTLDAGRERSHVGGERGCKTTTH